MKYFQIEIHFIDSYLGNKFIVQNQLVMKNTRTNNLKSNLIKQARTTSSFPLIQHLLVIVNPIKTKNKLKKYIK